MRRRSRASLLLVATLVVTASAVPTVCAESLTIVTWGGAYERSQTEAYFEPFTAATGIDIQIEQYDGGIDELRSQVVSGSVTWDLVDLIMADNIRACDEGLLEPIDHASLPPAPDGTPAEEDFLEGSLTRCGVPEVIYATVLAFDARAFPALRPSTVSALFDLKRFPGKRALQRRPIAVLEWALRSYGVPREEIYNLLSTERGLDLAFDRLDEIRGDIIWWEDGSEPVKLLTSGEVVIASGYNGRFFDAAVNQGVPIRIIWDGQLYDYSTWAIPRGAPRAELAWKFVRFATDTQSLAEQAKYISYGPARKSSAALVWKHARAGIDMRPYLPTYPAHFRRAIRRDHEWYAHVQPRLKQRFFRWLNEAQ